MEKKFTTYAFVFAAAILMGELCYFSGFLSSEYGNHSFKILIAIGLPWAIFFAGRWYEKHKKHNPL
jgi:hypothetical protein